MHKLHELKEKLMRELEGYADNGKYSKDDVEVIKYMTSAIDHICNIMEESDEYSEAMRNPYEGGRSYRRGGYMRSGRRGANQYGSYMGGYSRANDSIIGELREIAKDSPNDRVRQEINELVTRIEGM